MIGQIIFGVIDAAVFGIDPATDDPRRIFVGIFQLAVLLPMLAVGWRRMHDTGRPGWYILIPALISIAFLALVMTGVITFAALTMSVDEPAVLIGPAALFGSTSLMVLGLMQVVATIILLVWLTRPSEAGANAYGPTPARV